MGDYYKISSNDSTDDRSCFVRRRSSTAVRIGEVTIGYGHPVAVQTMTDTDTNDVAGSVAQIERIADAGCRMVRLTVQGMREAKSMEQIAALVRERWPGVALVADVHFLPEVALAVAGFVDKVRINPGNYNDGGGDFDALLDKCAAHGTALRIGVNHGSLSPSIVEKYGDTPRGMTESAMEFLEKCRAKEFDQVVVSMKSSNVRVMVHAYRMLAERMAAAGFDCPLHLGVTEAGSGTEGRIKSAAGIGALLADGLGDTIRVSLTEPPENEIPAACALVNLFSRMGNCEYSETWNHKSCTTENFGWSGFSALFDPCSYSRRMTSRVGRLGGGGEPLLWSELDEDERHAVENGHIALLTATGADPVGQWRKQIAQLETAGDHRPVILHRLYGDTSTEWSAVMPEDMREGSAAALEDSNRTTEALTIRAAADFGIMLLDGLADGLHIEAPALSAELIDTTSLDILQATRARITKTEYIACPGCGRTLYDLHGTLEEIKRHTAHLKGVKIAVMGCIVNGPGEMVDADYGYVGASRGHITLYRGHEPVLKNIPQEEALGQLVALLKQDGRWIELDN